MARFAFPIILIILQFGAGIVYWINRDKWTAAYWIVAAVLNITVTFKP